MSGKIEIPMFSYYQTESMFKALTDRGIDSSKCCVCGKPIEKKVRGPHFLDEKLKAVLIKKTFYEYNVSGICKDGVICDRPGCFETMYWRREK